jgi:glycosyltransferase involved in cell wall biosynthesis
VGGGFNFHVTVLEALSRVTTRHEIILLDIGGFGSGAWSGDGLPQVDVRAMFPPDPLSGNPAPLTELAALKLGLDVVWYLDPPAEVLTVPVFATVLDLAHRQHPFFPEVSVKDWVWSEREGYYAEVLPRAARILVGTQTGKNQIIRCYGVNPANVIVNPFPTPVLAPSAETLRHDEVLTRHGLSPGYLFYPAQFWPHKNHVNLLLALKYLETAHGLTPVLVLTGSDKGNLPHVVQVIDELALGKRVHILGFVPGTDMASLYQNAAALVYPSFFGPDNLPPLEAFSLGCPVLAGRIEGVEEQLGRAVTEPRIGDAAGRFRSLTKLVLSTFKRNPRGSHPDDRESGFAGYFDPARPEDIAAAMARVLREADFRASLIEHGHALAAGRTPDAYVQVVLRALDEFEPWRRNWPAGAMR